MIWIGDKRISELWVGGKKVAALYVGMKLVWQAITSCFGSGIWLKDEVWNGDDLWIND